MVRLGGNEPKQVDVKQIDILPDDVLLEIFDFYVKTKIEAWQSLVHVCRRWRSLVFRSPRRLNLRLACTPKTPVRDTLDVWPALPLIVQVWEHLALSLAGLDNVIVALEQSNRVCEVDLLPFAGSQPLEKVLAKMQVPFPELTELRLFSNDETPPVIPDSFLDGSAPRLRHLHLLGIPFPGLPKLLLSANHLVSLLLLETPHSAYISPEAMVALLSVLSCLRTLYLEFESPQSRPDSESRSLLPLQRSILPALDKFHFKGVTEYLEDLVTSIDAPQLETLNIYFFNQTDFDTPRFAQFINRTRTFEKDDAEVIFDDWSAILNVGLTGVIRDIEIILSCEEPDRQLSSIGQVSRSCFHLVSAVKDLYIKHYYSQIVWKNDAIENALWVELLLPFTTVKNLYLSKEFAPGVAAALQELVGGRIAEVLPSLQNVFVGGFEPSGPFQENIGQFVTARQLSNHRITISVWDEG